MLLVFGVVFFWFVLVLGLGLGCFVVFGVLFGVVWGVVVCVVVFGGGFFVFVGWWVLVGCFGCWFWFWGVCGVGGGCVCGFVVFCGCLLLC
ncbi:hypothetical protein, partial [Acinetobacter baumannii]